MSRLKVRTHTNRQTDRLTNYYNPLAVARPRGNEDVHTALDCTQTIRPALYRNTSLGVLFFFRYGKYIFVGTLSSSGSICKILFGVPKLKRAPLTSKYFFVYSLPQLKCTPQYFIFYIPADKKSTPKYIYLNFGTNILRHNSLPRNF